MRLTFSRGAIWVIFIADFVLRLIIAPKKTTFLRHNALTAISLILPAPAVLRLGRILSLLPTSQVALLRLVSSLNRTFNAFVATMQRRGLAYVIVIVVAVVFAGAAGMLSFERDQSGSPMSTYGYALWWTSMIMTHGQRLLSPQHRRTNPLPAAFDLCFFGLGYLTGAISSYFINKDASDASSPIPDADQLRELTDEIRALRAEVAQLRVG